jgi:hypothetical protein
VHVSEIAERLMKDVAPGSDIDHPVGMTGALGGIVRDRLSLRGCAERRKYAGQAEYKEGYSE